MIVPNNVPTSVNGQSNSKLIYCRSLFCKFEDGSNFVWGTGNFLQVILQSNVKASVHLIMCMYYYAGDQDFLSEKWNQSSSNFNVLF